MWKPFRVKSSRPRLKNNHKIQKHGPAADWPKEAAWWHSHLDGVPQLIGVIHGRQHQQAQDDAAEVPTQLWGQVISQVLWAETEVRKPGQKPRHDPKASQLSLTWESISNVLPLGGVFSQFGVERPHCTRVTACGRRHDSLFLPACKNSTYIHTQREMRPRLLRCSHNFMDTSLCHTVELVLFPILILGSRWLFSLCLRGIFT